MAATSLSALHNHSKHWNVTVFVSRLWHHRGGTDNGPIKHTDLVVLDIQGNHMYVEIAADYVIQFMNLIEEGRVYDLSRFMVYPRKTHFRPVEARFMIKVGRYTSVQERNVPGDVDFPFCMYALTPIANLPRPTDLPERFTGVSKAVQFHGASRTEPSIKRIIYLSDFIGNQISIVLWGERATAFDGDWVVATAKESPVIVIFVGTLVKAYDGRRGLSGNAACRRYINDNLPEINEIHRRLKDKIPVVENIMLPGQSDDEISAQINLETKTVAELLALNIYDNEHVKFYCTATLTRLSPSQRWWFSSCNACHRSSVPYGSAYRCSDPDCSCTDALPRYRLCYMASDGDEEIELIFFDRMGKEIIGKPLISVLRAGQSHGTPLEEVVQSSRNDMSTPRELAAVVARKYRFVVSVSSKSFDPEYGQSSFQVHRIDADLGKQSNASALRRGPALLMASSSKSVSNAAATSSLSLLPGSSSEHISAAVTELSDGPFSVEHADDQSGHTIASLPTPPSVNKTNVTRTRTAPLTSNVRKPLFQGGEDKGKESEQTDKVLQISENNNENEKVVKDTTGDPELTKEPSTVEPLPVKPLPVKSLHVEPLPMPTEKKRRAQSLKGTAAADPKKAKTYTIRVKVPGSP